MSIFTSLVNIYKQYTWYRTPVLSGCIYRIYMKSLTYNQTSTFIVLPKMKDAEYEITDYNPIRVS